MSIILASQSPYRKAQLEALGISFRAVKPKADEELLKTRGPRDLSELTRFLARAKAESLRADFTPEDAIIGSDQLAELDGDRLDKPGTRDRAIAQLTRLQGRTHRLITSVVLLKGAQEFVHTEITTVTLRALSAEEISAYVDLDQPLDCAGSYKVERAGPGLMASIEGRDPSAIQGLPLIGLCAGFRQLGIPLWRPK